MITPTEEKLRVHTDAGEFDVAAKVRKVSDDWIIFLHGWGCAKEAFDEAFEIEQLGNYSMCSMDFLGFGQSDKPHEFSYDLPDHALVVAEAVRLLGANGVYLAGHSMGGGAGLLSTQYIRDRLKKFISVEGVLIPSDSRTMRQLTGYSYPMFDKVFFPMAKKAVKTSKRPDDKQWSLWLSAADPWAAYNSGKSATAWSDSGKLLPIFLDLPEKAYIFGENSARVPHIVPKLRGVDTRKIVHSEHFPMIDNPKDFYTTLEELIIGGSK